MPSPKQSIQEFQHVYETHSQWVYALLNRMMPKSWVEDVFQEVFIKIWKGLSLFQHRSEYKTWITRIAIHAVYDHHRKKKIKSDSTSEASPSDTTDSQSSINQISNHELVAKGLAQLSQEQQTVLILFYLQDMGVEEMALTLEVPIGTIKSRLHIARSNMLNTLQKMGVTP